MTGIRPFSRNDWTSAPQDAVLKQQLSPGIAGLHSVQGEGSAFDCKVEKTMTDMTSSRAANAGIKPARKTTRREQLNKLLTRKSGATIAQIQKAFGWQRHTARAAISAQRKAGHTIERDDSGKGPVYRIVKVGRSL